MRSNASRSVSGEGAGRARLERGLQIRVALAAALGRRKEASANASRARLGHLKPQTTPDNHASYTKMLDKNKITSTRAICLDPAHASKIEAETFLEQLANQIFTILGFRIRVQDI